MNVAAHSNVRSSSSQRLPLLRDSTRDDPVGQSRLPIPGTVDGFKRWILHHQRVRRVDGGLAGESELKCIAKGTPGDWPCGIQSD
jgi:hypothetical protein